MDYQAFRNRLLEEAEEGYRDFVLGGTITERPLLGVRVPKCRELAKGIVRGEFGESGERAIHEFLENEPVSFEEVMIRGFVITKLSYDEMVRQMYKFIPLIDNWEICDCFCVEMKKNVRANKEKFLDEIDKMLKSLDEFQTRVGLVCLLDHYVTPEYLAVIFDRVSKIGEFLSDGPGEMSVEREKNKREMLGVRVRKVLSWDAYYVKMAVAWLISVCFAKYPEETVLWFSDLKLPTWTYNKAIAKTRESYRVDKELKETLKKLKR